MLDPLNDLAKIQLDSDEFNFGGNNKDTSESGVLVSLPDKFNYFGMWSFAFESSWMDEDKLQKIYDYYKGLIGKRVYWTALSEKGNIIDEDEKRFAYVKFTSLIAVGDANSKATNIHGDGKGAFSV